MEIVKKLIDEFNSDEITQKLNSKLKSNLGSKSFMDIMSISRRETSHSSFIHWLLDFNNNYDLDKYPLKEFLKLLLKSNSFNETTINDDIRECLLNNLLSDKLEIKSEFSYFNTEEKVANGRIDIIFKLKIEYLDLKRNKVENSLNILIENKVDSKETNSQTIKYEEFLKNKKDITLLTYLSPSKEKIYNPISDKFIHISYQELLDKVLQPSLNKTDNDKVKFYLGEYITNLGIVNKSIMALSKEDKKLLEKFWKENQELIRLALEARLNNDDLSETEKKNTVKVIDSIEKETVGIYVRSALKKILKEKKIPEEEINRLTEKEYSYNIFGINYPVLLEIKRESKKRKKNYWKGSVKSYNKKYVICCEWYERMRTNFENWEKKISI